MAAVALRRLNMSDALVAQRCIAQVFARTQRHHDLGLTSTTLEPHISHIVAHVLPQNLSVGAFYGGQLVGCLITRDLACPPPAKDATHPRLRAWSLFLEHITESVHSHLPTSEPGCFAFGEYLAIEPSMQNQGLGKQLSEFSDNCLAARGFQYFGCVATHSVTQKPSFWGGRMTVAAVVPYNDFEVEGSFPLRHIKETNEAAYIINTIADCPSSPV
eukprot:TRINITY_DN7640_c0_g1_i2.p1 TRINITY_DN7640_c0_g1~~TRINITY_DN7640_c0_g1_i2.p1  ORF type:complete len:216 (-),score=27.35 TRINITY_DN7640_c0_g1_i2:102-749(-)